MVSWNYSQKIVNVDVLQQWNAELAGLVATAKAVYAMSQVTGIGVEAAKAELDLRLKQQAEVSSDLEICTYAMNGG